jgi:hypothetical protein
MHSGDHVYLDIENWTDIDTIDQEQNWEGEFLCLERMSYVKASRSEKQIIMRPHATKNRRVIRPVLSRTFCSFVVSKWHARSNERMKFSVELT